MVKYNVKLYFFNSRHLHQIYDGFYKLEKQGICKLEWTPYSFGCMKPVLRTEINGKTVIFDCLDGYNWINASIEENLKAYQKDFSSCDYYFKRSYDPQYGIGRPLGLNYEVLPEFFPPFHSQTPLEWLLFSLYNYFPIPMGPLTCERISYEPKVKKDGKVIFLCRLWDPDNTNDNDFRTERRMINQYRIDLVATLRRELGDLFVGGISRDSYSAKHCPKELLMPHFLTYRKTYIKTMHNCNIGIATDGLHKSIGWKFGEYVASSKAIVTESLKYQVTGDFREGKNYLCFNDDTSLIKQVRSLLNDEKAMSDMMRMNHRYFNQYVRPDQFVLRALEQIEM